MERIQYVCDVCGAEKKDANHWWEIVEFISPLSHGPLQIYRWSGRLHMASPTVSGRARYHLCGHGCVLRKVEEFMTHPPRTSVSDPSTVVVCQNQEDNVIEDQQPQWTENGPMKEGEIK